MLLVWVLNGKYNWKNNDGILVRSEDLDVNKQETERYFDVQLDRDQIQKWQLHIK